MFARGWNSWNLWGCDINETIVRQTADTLVHLGLDQLGYNYVNVDDCWQVSVRFDRHFRPSQPLTARVAGRVWQTHRDQHDKIVADPVKFPSGIKALADYVHSLGLKFGIYSDAGNFTCAGRPGSLDYEDIDAATYAQWGVDYLKVCRVVPSFFYCVCVHQYRC